MAKGVIGNLRVNMGLDSAQFQAGMKEVQTSAERFSKVLKTSMVAAAAAVSAAMAAVSVAVKRTIASANNLGDVADRLGVNVERLQELRYAAERGGMGVQNFDVALRRFIRRAAEAAKGTGAAKNAFKELGISLRDTNGRLKPSEALLHEVADAMQKVPNSADKLRLAFQMFDTDGAAMVNVLANGSAGMKEMAAEAQRLGLVLSEDTVRSAQAITDNFEMAGNVIGGMVNRLTAFLAPAIVVVSEAVVAMALKLHDLIDVLPVVAEYAAVAGGALAIMAAPSIIASVGSLAVAIKIGLVGAVKLLTAAIVANPLGALAVGIAAAVTAIYHFRDEIQKAIGVDVVGIVKTAANYILNSFRAAYEDLKFIWGNFGNIMGAAVIGGVNIAIRAIDGLIQKAISGIDWLIDALNKIPGIGIDKLGGSFGLKELENPYSDAVEGALKQHNERIKQIMSEDLIGAISEAMTISTPAAVEFNNSLEGIATSAGGAASKLKEMQAEAARIFEATRTPLERYQAQIARLNELLAAGAISQDTYNRAVAQAQDAFTKAEEAGNKAQNTFQQIGQSIGQAFSSAFQGLIDGSKKAKDVLADLLSQLSSMLMNSAFQALFGGGMAGGGILGNLFSGLGFRANGGPVMAGRPYIVGERGPELMVPNTSGSVIKNSDLSGGGRLDVYVHAEEGKMFRPVIRAESQGVAVKVVQAAAPGIMEGSVTATQAAARQKPGLFR